ncbi:hypothetical protein L3Q82_008346 [Scortum barcoo]|uniref:Uncharacterized protein n=1 Tax=Scortum barcoo TaxID=214431 RepID=A0ACB8WHM2_9TELE|nr:hypothetical protein L3Q82_008346 [Scortum barcoo]
MDCSSLYGKGGLELPVSSLTEKFKCSKLGRGGLGTGESRPSWRKATPSQCRGLVVDEVRRQEQVMRRTKAVTHAKQGQWMRWEEVKKRRLMEGVMGNGGT